MTTTPNSAMCMVSSVLPTRFEEAGADGDPGEQVAEHRTEAELGADRHADDRRGEVDARLLQVLGGHRFCSLAGCCAASCSSQVP